MPPQGRTNFQTSPRDRFVDTQDSVEKLGEQLVLEIWLDDSELQWLAKKVVVPDWRFFVGVWVMWSSLSLGTEGLNNDHSDWRTDTTPPTAARLSSDRPQPSFCINGFSANKPIRSNFISWSVRSLSHRV